MKLTEIAEQEPFVVTMLSRMLKKDEQPPLVIVQDGGAESYMGKITSMRVAQQQHMEPDYVLMVVTNSAQEYAYSAQRLRRADIRPRKAAFKDGVRVVNALYVPSSGNQEDLGGHDL
jgi:hypothetical protein